MLAEQIQDDLRDAMKARDTNVVSALRMLLAAIKNARVAKGHSGQVSDAEVTDLLTKEVRQRTEAAEAFESAGRTDLATKERAALDVLRRYLPEPLSDQELRELVDQAIVQTAARSPADLGRVMGALMPKVKGRAEGRRVNALVRERLG